jgi:hypothetical protein
MRITYLLITLLSLLILTQCADEGVNTTLLFKESYSLPFPIGTKPNSSFQKYKENEQSRNLYILNEDKQIMFVYDINTKKISDSFEFIKEGPGAPGKVLGFTVIDNEKMALSSGMKPYSLIINHDNQVLDTLDYAINGIQQQEGYLRQGARDYVDFAFGQEKHFFIQRPFYRGRVNRPATVDHNPIIVHDVAEKTNRLHPFKFPKDHWEKGLESKMTFNHDEEHLYFSLTASHDLYRINRQTEKVDIFKIKSKYAPDDMPSQLEMAGPVDVMIYDASNVRYTATLPDPYRKMVYRVATLPPSGMSIAKKKYNQLHMYPDRFSLIICNEKMEVIGEHTFPERTYFPHGVFVSRDGIHVPASHPEYLVANGVEDSVRYDVFIPTVK